MDPPWGYEKAAAKSGIEANQKKVFLALAAALTDAGGPDYGMLASTNLRNWETLFATNEPPGIFTFDASEQSTAAQRFCRIVLEP